MGPHSGECGKTRKSHEKDLIGLLQWGRTPVSAERLLTAARTKFVFALQWGRTPVSAERKTLPSDWNICAVLQWGRTPVRKVALPLYGWIHDQGLQWGRTPVSAERVEPVNETVETVGFNGAALR